MIDESSHGGMRRAAGSILKIAGRASTVELPMNFSLCD
jgi:hypothetical protein